MYFNGHASTVKLGSFLNYIVPLWPKKKKYMLCHKLFVHHNRNFSKPIYLCLVRSLCKYSFKNKWCLEGMDWVLECYHLRNVNNSFARMQMECGGRKYWFPLNVTVAGILVLLFNKKAARIDQIRDFHGHEPARNTSLLLGKICWFSRKFMQACKEQRFLALFKCRMQVT